MEPSYEDGEVVVYTVACSGGCGKVYDVADDPCGVYVCRRCQMMCR